MRGKRGSGGGGDANTKASKKAKTTKSGSTPANKKKDGAGGDGKKSKAADFESLSKEELEKRLSRAEKFGLANENVDAMKAALRKFRFEKKEE
jgi:hypothetical protein